MLSGFTELFIFFQINNLHLVFLKIPNANTREKDYTLFSSENRKQFSKFLSEPKKVIFGRIGCSSTIKRAMAEYVFFPFLRRTCSRGSAWSR